MISRNTIKYVSASGKVLALTDGTNYANYAKLPNWSLDTVSLNGRIVGVRNAAKTFTIPVNILADTDSGGLEARNALFEIPATDVGNNTPGRLYFDDWYIEGYMTASEVSNFWQMDRQAEYVLKFTATKREWVRETVRSYTEQYDAIGVYLDFPYDFAYDYGVSKQVFTITNENYSESPIMLRVFGIATNPHVKIAGNEYRVNVSIDAGEYLEINGLEHTVTLVRINGERENVFGSIVGDFKKGSGSYIFQPIPAGESEVLWTGEFDFDIVTYELRSEPRWS